MCMPWFTSLVIVFIVLVSQFNTLYSDGDCFQVNSKECSNLKSCKCGIQSTQQDGSLVYCCNLTSTEELEDNLRCAGANSIRALHILRSNLSRLEANVLMFSKMVNLAITDNNITQIHGQFRLNELICLNLSSNSLSEVDPYILQQTSKLAMFDISRNNIQYLPEFKSLYPRLDVSGNLQLTCKSLLIVVEQLRRNKMKEEDKFMYRNETTCLPTSLQWLNEQVVPFRLIEDTKMIDRDCPVVNDVKCDCSVHSFDYGLVEGEFSFRSKVDCSNRKLTSLPKTLPTNTFFLNVSNNNITTLEEIGTNEGYSVVKELYADNNMIPSLKPLEGSKFLYAFNILSLKGNKINSLQPYMFINVFERDQAIKLSLGNNYLNCNCATDKHLKPWLLLDKIKNHIQDADEIFCGHPNVKVIELSSQIVCPTQTTYWKDYIHYIIALEIIMFLLLIAKVSYDYYIFKSAGYLPWPASKMPKLPCDWCFET